MITISYQMFSSAQRLFKTQMCRSVLQNKICAYGNKCTFAHSEQELPQKRYTDPRAKTQMCKSVFQGIYCKYGDRCMYAHSEYELVRKMCINGFACENDLCECDHTRPYVNHTELAKKAKEAKNTEQNERVIMAEQAIIVSVKEVNENKFIIYLDDTEDEESESESDSESDDKDEEDVAILDICEQTKLMMILPKILEQVHASVSPVSSVPSSPINFRCMCTVKQLQQQYFIREKNKNSSVLRSNFCDALRAEFFNGSNFLGAVVMESKYIIQDDNKILNMLASATLPLFINNNHGDIIRYSVNEFSLKFNLELYLGFGENFYGAITKCVWAIYKKYYNRLLIQSLKREIVLYKNMDI
jgi:hypothetical protein